MTNPTPIPPTITPPRRDAARGFVGSALRGLFVVLLSVALSVAAVGALAYFYLGYTPEAPGRIQVLQTEVVSAQLDLQAQGQRNAALQTAVADLSTRQGASREEMQDVAKQVADLQSLGQQMQENNALAATVQAEARDSRTAVAVFSTAQAARAAQLDELQRRAERISRFLARLGDISSDAANDLEPQGTALPLATIAPQPTIAPAAPTNTAAPTATAAPTGTVAPTATLAATATPATRTVTATP